MTVSRGISTASQLGAAIHDARIAAGYTQAELAAAARVSREWLIGIEQGARPRAELGKIFDIMGALDLAFGIQPRTGGRTGTGTPSGRGVPTAMKYSTADPTPGRSRPDPGELARKALEGMRGGARIEGTAGAVTPRMHGSVKE